jgi:hypothetical protein
LGVGAAFGAVMVDVCDPIVTSETGAWANAETGSEVEIKAAASRTTRTVICFSSNGVHNIAMTEPRPPPVWSPAAAILRQAPQIDLAMSQPGQ